MSARGAVGAALAAVLLLASGAAMAQTAVERSSPPPGSPPGAERVAPPVPESAVRQAKAQAAGRFPAMLRPRTAGQVQEVWDKSKPGAAVYEADACWTCTYKVRLREYMVTLIELPEGERIARADLGDRTHFTADGRGPRRLAVMPAGYGYDTDLIVHGASGRVYVFYLRAESVNSERVPDLLVRIRGHVSPSGAAGAAVAGIGGGEDDDGDGSASPPSKSSSKSGASGADGGGRAIAGPAEAAHAEAVSGLVRTAPETPAGDFVPDAPFDPDALRGWGDYELWGDDALRPETVFRDDVFTYIRFGDRWKSVELPTAYVVVDGIDELVNTRVRGSTYIVESVQRLISLKSGKKYLCIRYTGDER